MVLTCIDNGMRPRASREPEARLGGLTISLFWIDAIARVYRVRTKLDIEMNLSTHADIGQVDCLVVGAGVVGLAIARALAQRGHEVVIAEANRHFGEESSSRNNEVVHAGSLYAKDSLREHLCGRGREQLTAYCAERAIGHTRMGKPMPATSATELALLYQYHARARELGIPGVTMLSGSAVHALEPQLVCERALYSPTTAIVDTHGLMLSLLGDAQAGGADLAVNTRVIGATRSDTGFTVEIASPDGDGFRLRCNTLVNAAGLGALPLARTLPGYPVGLLPAIHLANGNFFTYPAPAPFRHLIMPVGHTLASGAAFTLDLAGQGRFGPNLQWVTNIDYRVDADAGPLMAAAVRRYWPGIDAKQLMPGYTGIRPRRPAQVNRHRTGKFKVRRTTALKAWSICSQLRHRA